MPPAPQAHGPRVSMEQSGVASGFSEQTRGDWVHNRNPPVCGPGLPRPRDFKGTALGFSPLQPASHPASQASGR